jgi:hypothetical protein
LPPAARDGDGVGEGWPQKWWAAGFMWENIEKNKKREKDRRTPPKIYRSMDACMTNTKLVLVVYYFFRFQLIC